MKTCWNKLVLEEAGFNDDVIERVCVGPIYDNKDDRFVDIDSPEMMAEFDPGYGSAEGCAFTAWGQSHVYFPVQYDGSESVCSVPRHPILHATTHFGGG